MTELVYKNEKALTTIVMVIGVIFWLLITIGTLGLVWLFALFAFLAYLFAQSAFVSHLRGNCIELSGEQMPELYRQYTESCEKLGVADPPRAYLMMSDGVLNALAARFLRRHYVVVFSSIIEALKSRPEAVRFYFGHEIAHVIRGHLDYRWLKMPGSALPLLGPAFRRAQEYTCDLHGMAAAASPQDSVAALTVLASGGEKLPQVNVAQFVAQQQQSGGFWMSYHELTGDYPWLAKRVANILRASGSVAAGELQAPRRSILAGVLAFFTPRIGAGGGAASLLIFIAIVGVLAAIAVPAYADYKIRAQVAEALGVGTEVRAAATPYLEENGAFPDTPSEVGLPEELDSGPVASIHVGEDGFVLTLRGDSAAMDGQTIVFGAYQNEDGSIGWTCDGGTLEAKYRPTACR